MIDVDKDIVFTKVVSRRNYGTPPVNASIGQIVIATISWNLGTKSSDKAFVVDMKLPGFKQSRHEVPGRSEGEAVIRVKVTAWLKAFLDIKGKTDA